MQTDRNLLLGVLALQMDFITPDALLAGMRGWFSAKTKSLGQILVEQSALSHEQMVKLEAVVSERMPTTAAAEEADPDRTKKYTPPPPPPPRYRVRHFHARGGLGQIFLAEDEELHRDVALKEIQNKYADDRDSRARFVLEAEVTGGLEHPGIVPVYGLGTYADGRPYYAMRFIRGHSLQEAIQQLHRAETPDRDPAAQALALRELLDRFLDVCNAVAYAHSRGVLHRDLKPANVMLGSYGETLVVDWGLARLLDLPERSSDTQPGPLRPTTAGKITPTRIGAGSGSPTYMAPEQEQGRPDLIHVCTDVYGLGGILFEILTGQPPHPQGVRGPVAPRPRSVRPTVPAALDEIVARALSPEPADRYPTAQALAEEVRRWLAEEPVATFRTFAVELERRVRNHPNTPEYREHLARCHANLGLVLEGMGRPADSVSAYQAAIAECTRLAHLSPSEPRYRAELATCRIHLGRVLGTLGRLAEAGEVQQAAVAEYNQLITANPQDYRTNMASVMLTIHPDLDLRPDRLEEELATSPPQEPLPSSGSTLMPIQEGDPESREEMVAPGELPVHSRARLTILQRLAQGGLGSVSIARDNDLNRQVALKAYEGPFNRAARQRFLREAQITAQLEHPNIVPVYGLGFRPKNAAPFIIMRFISGRTLQEAIQAHHAHEEGARPQELRRLLHVFADACQGLAYAHSRGVIHRDPKPSNILLGPNGEVFVADWGLAELTGEALEGDPVQVSQWADLAQTDAGQIVGTPAYMAPEMASGTVQQKDIRLDVYSLGATLFHILTGHAPHEGLNPVDMIRRLAQGGPPPQAQSVNPAVPPALNAICARAMAYRPEDRYATVSLLREDVISWLEGRPVSAFRETDMERVSKKARVILAALARKLVVLANAGLRTGRAQRLRNRDSVRGP